MQKDGKEKIIEFTYDPFGRRLSKAIHREEIENDGDDDRDDDDRITPRATYYVYDNEDIIMEYNHKGKVTARYVHGLGIDEPLAIERKGEVYYYHADGLGSITSLTDKKQKVVESYEYDSFGNLKRKGDKVKNTFTYTGREWDKEIELYYYRARYYDAKAGRFLQKDPFPGFIDLPQTLNHYSYTVNNPINFIDPYGYLTWGERAFTVGVNIWRVVGPIKVYVEGLGWLKPVPFVPAVIWAILDPEKSIITQEEEMRLLEEYKRKKKQECNK